MQRYMKLLFFNLKATQRVNIFERLTLFKTLVFVIFNTKMVVESCFSGQISTPQHVFIVKIFYIYAL